jgi:hypothetical protein
MTDKRKIAEARKKLQERLDLMFLSDENFHHFKGELINRINHSNE